MDLGVRDLAGLPLLTATDDGPAWAALLVRVGWADEPLSRAGLTHLVEHLALRGADLPGSAWNGRVDATTTVFEAEGSPQECAAFLRRVGTALADLPLDGLEVEGRVLRSEAARHRRSSVVGRLLAVRCGPAGYGAAEQDEYGLRAPDADAVRDWTARRFTRRASVAVWTGPPPPPDLACPLPDGPPAPPVPPLAARPGLPLPVWAHDDGPLAVGLLLRRGWAGRAAARVLRRRLQQALRHDRGLAYEVAQVHGAASADRAHVGFVVDGQDEHATEAARVLDDVLLALADEGPTEAELHEVRARFEEALRDPVTWVAEQAHAVLEGRPVQQPGQAAQELAALGPADLAEVLREALPGAVLLLPDVASPPRRYRSLVEAEEAPPPDGERFRTRGRLPSARDVLVIGDHGLSLQVAGGPAVALLWDEVVLAELDADGTCALTGVRGDWVRLRPDLYREPERVRAALTASLPPDVVVPSHRAAGTAQVLALAPQQLGRLRSVEEELRMLGGVLREGETLELLGRGMSRLDLGLLAVTDQRTLFLFAPDDRVVEHPHHLQRGAHSARRLLAQDLVLDAADGPTCYRDVDPKGRAEQMAAAVRRACGAA